MLIGHLTPNAAGLTIKGDYLDLDALYETIHDVSNGLVESSFASNQLMELAYEIRKAKDGRRDIEDVTPYENEPRITYKATKVILIDFLPTLSTLRNCMAYKTSNEKHQASVYALERLTKNALLEKDAKRGLSIYEWTQNFVFSFEKLASPLLEMATIDYLNAPPKKRLGSLQRILMEYFINGETKDNAIKNLENEAKKLLCKPEELTFEMPEFEW